MSLRVVLNYLKKHRSAILLTIVALQNGGLLSGKAADLLTAIAGM